jgi:hypothetical protein
MSAPREDLGGKMHSIGFRVVVLTLVLAVASLTQLAPSDAHHACENTGMTAG